jgi:hypothetical protein
VRQNRDSVLALGKEGRRLLVLAELEAGAAVDANQLVELVAIDLAYLITQVVLRAEASRGFRLEDFLHDRNVLDHFFDVAAVHLDGELSILGTIMCFHFVLLVLILKKTGHADLFGSKSLQFPLLKESQRPHVNVP